MGFDVYGISPVTPKGEYFRNNCWWWRPLWEYICIETCPDIVSVEDWKLGGYNANHPINEMKANMISARLTEKLENGHTAKYSEEYQAKLDAIQDEPCKLCKGTGIRKDAFVNGTCNACHGKGKVRPMDCEYPFSVENVREFVEFCKNSGGFKIG